MRTDIRVVGRRCFLRQEFRGVLERQSRPLEGCACSVVHLAELAQVHHRAYFEHSVPGKVRNGEIGSFLDVHFTIPAAWIVAKIECLGRVTVEADDAWTDDRAVAVVTGDIPAQTIQ